MHIRLAVSLALLVAALGSVATAGAIHVTSQAPVRAVERLTQASATDTAPNMTIVSKGFDTKQVFARVDDLASPPPATKADRLPVPVQTALFSLADLSGASTE